MYVSNEKELAKAIMRNEPSITMTSSLANGVSKIKDPSDVIWKSVASALVASAFFWGSAGAVALGFTVGLPAILAVCGGVGGVVFVTLGASGTICAYKLLMQAKKIDVLNNLRNKYNLTDNTLTRK